MNPKEHVCLALLGDGGNVWVCLDPKAPGVDVPIEVHENPAIVIGLNMPVPIPDLVVDSEGISGTLSFNRQGHFCRVPWAAVDTLHDGVRGFMFRKPEESEAEQQARGEAFVDPAMPELPPAPPAPPADRLAQDAAKAR